MPARLLLHAPELSELTVGIIGMGRIGSRVGGICRQGFGARVIYHDIAEVGPFPFDAEPAALEELLRAADVITLHVPLTPLTRGMISADAFGKLMSGATLINTARGAVVDTAALVAALRSGQLGSAGLDVVEPEPLPAEHPLHTMDNCLLTPHCASRTPGAMRRMSDVVDQVLAFLGATDPQK